MAVKTLVTSFGQLTGAPSDSSSLDAVIGVELIDASTNTVLTGTSNKKVFVDTTSTPISITLPSGTTGQNIDIIDAGENAGTNIITIIGTIDGVLNATIEADSGSMQISYSGTAWESSGGFNQFFRRNAATGVISTKSPDILLANIIKGGEESTTYEGLIENFSNAEDNVNQGVNGWGNISINGSTAFNTGNYNTNATTPYSVDSSSNDTVYGGANWKAFNNAFGIADSWAATSGFPQWIELSTGSSRTFGAYRISGYTGGTSTYAPKDWTLQGWNGSEWVTLHTVTNSTGHETGWSQLYTVDVLGSYSKHRINITATQGGGVPLIGEIDFRESLPATTTNTFQYRPLTGGASTSFAPSTLVVYDENLSQLVNGDILVEYSLDQGSSWPGGQRSLTDFKALGALTGTNFWLRFEMVGAKLLSEVEITTASSFATADSGGLDVVVSGTSIGGITPEGIITPSLTTSARDAVSSPPSGLLIFNSTTNKLNFYNGSAWEAITSA